jgi:hypothetical protein
MRRPSHITTDTHFSGPKSIDDERQTLCGPCLNHSGPANVYLLLQVALEKSGTTSFTTSFTTAFTTAFAWQAKPGWAMNQGGEARESCPKVLPGEAAAVTEIQFFGFYSLLD